MVFGDTGTGKSSLARKKFERRPGPDAPDNQQLDQHESEATLSLDGTPEDGSLPRKCNRFLAQDKAVLGTVRAASVVFLKSLYC
jgi:hypothetical protein